MLRSIHCAHLSQCSIALDPCALVFYTGRSSFCALSFPLSWCCFVILDSCLRLLYGCCGYWSLCCLHTDLHVRCLRQSVWWMSLSAHLANALTGETHHHLGLRSALGKKKKKTSSIAIFLLFWSAGSGHKNSFCFTPITYSRKGTCTSPLSASSVAVWNLLKPLFQFVQSIGYSNHVPVVCVTKHRPLSDTM